MVKEQPLTVFRNLKKCYGTEKVVLENISIEVRQGEFVSFIGPSGCGKSTLLKLISGLIPPTEGELRVDGKTPGEAREEMAFIFQDATLLPWLTVGRNIQKPMRLRGVGKEKRAAIASKMCELVHLTPVVDYYPRQLSGGMKMRVSIARALALSPKILLLDEPFGALDEMTRDHLNEELLRIRAAEEWTAFFVTHSVAEAVFLSTRIIILSSNPGKIVNEVAVDFPYPRTADTRETAEYQRRVAEVSHHLRSVEQ